MTYSLKSLYIFYFKKTNKKKASQKKKKDLLKFPICFLGTRPVTPFESRKAEWVYVPTISNVQFLKHAG